MFLHSWACALAVLFTFAAAVQAQLKPAAKTDHARAFSELKIFDGGSPLRKPSEDWAGARMRVTQDAGWKKWLKTRTTEMDEWIAKCKDNVEWLPGYFHDFVAPNGSPLIWTMDEPKDYVLSKDNQKVPVTDKIRAAWVGEFRSKHADRIADAAKLHRLTGDAKYAEWAAAQLDYYAEHFLEWPLRNVNGQSRLGYHSLAEATLLVVHIEAVRQLGDFVSADRKRRWYTRLFQPRVQMLQQDQQAIHNIACWHRSAVGLVAIVYDDPVLWAQAVDSPFGIRNQLRQGVTSDYLWYEQSISYNAYVVQALLPFFTVASLAGKENSVREEMLILENLLLSPIMMRFPTGQLPNPADSSGGPRSAPDPKELSRAYRVFPTYIGLQQAVKERSWNMLLDPIIAPATPPPVPAVTTRHLAGSKMAILKGGPWQIYFHYGQLARSHAQAEALNFEAFYGNLDISHDPGTVGYGSPFHKEYYTKGLAHNVPLVNGHGQAQWSPGQVISFDERKNRIIAEQADYQPGFSARRDLQIVGDKLIDTVQILPKAVGPPQRLGQAIHLQGKATLTNAFKDDLAFPTNRPPAFGYWKNPKTATFAKSASLDIVYEGQTMRLEVLAAGPFTLTHASTPDGPSKKRDAFYLELATPGRQAAFQTTLEPKR